MPWISGAKLQAMRDWIADVYVRADIAESRGRELDKQVQTIADRVEELEDRLGKFEIVATVKQPAKPAPKARKAAKR